MVTRQERLNDFTVDGVPPSDLPMEVLCEDKSGTYALPYACRWADGTWFNCKAGTAIEAVVVGWRSWD
jgi:hypothetical protein